ncbi:MAG: ABC-ATPase domain-containing protein [Oscillospiraceae bacterium]|jgi:hypothetical protein|nr:ABC-ATPase domain-containing protein [Oscillospiraceae bacterium]
MKRLLSYLGSITDQNTRTYRYAATEDGRPVQREIYDGYCVVVHLDHGVPKENTSMRREPTFWRGDISYTLDRTNKEALDRPTVTIAVPAVRLGIADLTPAAADFCLRTIAPYFEKYNAEYANRTRPDSDNGKFLLHAPGSEVLLRNTAYFSMRPAKDYENGRGNVIYVQEYGDPPPDRMCLCVRMEIQLPHGKLKRAKKMLTQDLPAAAERFIGEFDREGLAAALALEGKQNAIREFLGQSDCCAFIANGSVLAREKGTRLPMQNALPFQSAPEDEIEVAGVRGMGVRRGVTVITGGGYSGKSTVLNAIAAGIYNHAAGDGRELCVTDGSAVTITAEDGRSVQNLNVSPFIQWIPGGNTRDFSTERASGSTSQAANIIEAVDGGAALLLIDEDRSATNFMIRDSMMKALIEKEPIIPFTGRVRELAARGVSTVLVIGGSGEYLSVADRVYLMDAFAIHDATARAKAIAGAPAGQPKPAGWAVRRSMRSGHFTSYPGGAGRERLEVSDTGFVIVGDERIDVRALHDIATPAQVDTLAFMLRWLMRGTEDSMAELEELAFAMRGLERKRADRAMDIEAKVRGLYAQIETGGLDVVDTGFFTGMNRFLELPRACELRAAIFRMRRVGWSSTV